MTISKPKSCPLLHLPLYEITLILLSFFCSPVNSAAVRRYNVVSFGAKPDGESDSAKAFLRTWDEACGSDGPAAIYVPAGRFLLGNVVFSGECKSKGISITIDGILVAPSGYREAGDDGRWVAFEHVDGVTIRGGVLDGQGAALWACKNKANNCPSGATSLDFSKSNNIVISGLTSLNSQMFHIVFNGCHNVKMEGVKVVAPGDSPNTDGIHIQLSSDVTILESIIRTGDDCVSIGPGTTNMLIQNVKCGPGHGISIGSLGWDLNEAGVQNVTVKTVTFSGTQNGVRIKTWGRPSNGFVRDVLFQDAIMVNVENPIVVDQNYCPGNTDCPQQASGVKINDITYKDIHGTSATEVAMKFDCSSKNPCSEIKLENVKLTYDNQVAQALCKHADGTTQGFVQPESCL